MSDEINETNSEKLKRLRYLAGNKGQCKTCRCRPVEPGRATCRTCLDAKRDEKAGHIAAGRCSCGKPRTVGVNRYGKPLRSCARCRRRRTKAATARRQSRREIGLCYCGAAVVPDRRRCEAHLRLGVESQRSARQKRQEVVP